ncbi:MAG: carbon-nitrogen hydrolase family protein [Methanopyri archaeon]|nr:carbon-nitrogen hydrolase family protein [Methanopyri archaeon]
MSWFPDGMTITAALCQFTPVPGDVETNCQRVLDTIELRKADLLIFPELFLTGYSAGERATELIPAVEEAARRIHAAALETECVVVCGMPEEGGLSGVIYNAALVAGLPDEGPSTYRKIHLPNFGIFKEKAWFAHGEDVPVFTVGDMTFGVAVCYDIFFPEVYRAMVLQGADIVITISASPTQSRKLFERMAPARAIETTCYHLYVNYVGDDGDLSFWGGSRAVSPLGDELVVAPVGEDGIETVELDLERVRADRQTRPVLRDVLLQTES